MSETLTFEASVVTETDRIGAQPPSLPLLVFLAFSLRKMFLLPFMSAAVQTIHDTPADPAARRESNLALLREMIDLGMQMARAAAAEVLDPEPAAANDSTPHPAPARPQRRSAIPAAGFHTARFRSADPHLAFARVTRGVRQAIALETRILDGVVARAPVRYTTHDPNQVMLRKFLTDVARKEPSPTARTQLCRRLDEVLDAEFRDRPETPIEESLVGIARQLGLQLDMSKVPDELLGMPTRSLKPDPNDPFRS